MYTQCMKDNNKLGFHIVHLRLHEVLLDDLERKIKILICENH